jgi:hypothetical protein
MIKLSHETKHEYARLLLGCAVMIAVGAAIVLWSGYPAI